MGFSRAMMRIGASIALILAHAARAEEAVADAANPVQCELHVWPSEGYSATYYGWFHGGTVDGALKQRTGYEQLSREMLSTARQIAQLEALALPDLLGLKDYRQIVHHEALSSRAIRTSMARHAGEAPPCYAELMVDTIVFQHNVLSGKAINTLARFRRFDGETQVQSYGGFALQAITVPSSGGATAGPEQVATAFEQAFAKGIGAFAADVQGSNGKRRTK